MTQSSTHPITSLRALRAGTAVAVASLWLGVWSVLDGSVYVWLMLLGVYVVSLSVAPLVLRSTGGDSGPIDGWFSRFVRVGGWFVLSGFLAIGLFVIYAIWRELTGRSLFPQ